MKGLSDESSLDHSVSPLINLSTCPWNLLHPPTSKSFPGLYEYQPTNTIMAKSLTKEEVAVHKKPDDLWIVIDEDVYNLTEFQSEHPGMCLLL